MLTIRNRKICRLCFIAWLLAGPIIFSPAHATTYYVNSAGKDTNDGSTPATAWKTINKVNTKKLKPGDNVLFAGGQTFIGSLYLDSEDGNDSLKVLTISSYGSGRAIIRSGTDFGIYIYNTQGIVISNLVVEGSGIETNLADGVSFYADLPGDVKLSNITIKNMEIRNFGKTGLSVGAWNKNTGFKNVLIEGVEVHHVRENGMSCWAYTAQAHVGFAHANVQMKNCYVHHVSGFVSTTHKGSGIIMGQVNNGVIERCVTHDNGAANTHCGGPGGIWVWDSNRIIIQHCESYRNSKGQGCDGFGFDLDGGVTNSVMQYNYSHDNDGAGFFLGQYAYARPWYNNTVRFNISENDARRNAGAVTIFKGPGTTMSGLKIYQNTIYVTPSSSNTTAAAFTIKKWNAGINGIEVYNNIFQTTGGVPLVSVPAGYSAYFAGNLYWPSGAKFKIKYQGVTHTGLATWQVATNNEKIGEIKTGIVGNPQLANAGSGGVVFPKATETLNAYTLMTSSAAIDAGLNLKKYFNIEPFTYDFFGNDIANDSTFDIGASQDVSVVTAREPIPLKDTLVNEAEPFFLFPNPVHHDGAVHLQNIECNPCTVEMIAASGDVVLKLEINTTEKVEIPMSGISPGIYVIRIISATGEVVNRQLVVE